MEFGVIGLNHHSTPVEIREKFAMTEVAMHKVLDHFSANEQTEISLVSTCNRFEVYFVTSQSSDDLRNELKELQGIDFNDYSEFMYYKTGQEAIRHLLRVICGLDSMVIGETQILGQIKQAWLDALSKGCSRKVLNSIFERAVRFGKLCHTESNLNHLSLSVSSVAVKLARDACGTLEGKTVLLAGAGEMARLAVDHLTEHKLQSLIIANRTIDKAQKLVEKANGRVVPLTELQDQLLHADVLITSTSADHYLVTYEHMVEVMQKRDNRPLVVIDICVPRNVEQGIQKVPGVQLFDIDSIRTKQDENEQVRRAEAQKIEAWINVELEETTKDLQVEIVIPLIKALQNQAEVIQQEAMKKIKNKIPNLDEHAYEVVNRFSKQAIKKVLNRPITRLREISSQAEEGNVHVVMDHFADLFDLEKVNDERLQQLIHNLNESSENKTLTVIGK